MSEDFVELCINKLESDLPSIFSRKLVPQLLGHTLSAGTLANLTCKGYGPPSIRNGRHSVYEKTMFLKWFRIYLKGGVKLIKETYTQKE